MSDNPFAADYREPAHHEPETDVFGLRPVETAKVEAKPDLGYLTAGIHRIPSAVYHADPAPLPSLSTTIGKLITAKSPLHAWHACRRLNPNWKPVDKKTYDIGRAAHRATLGCGDDYVVIPADILASNGAASTAAAKAFIADARENDLTPIVLDPERSELAGLAEIDGIWCRAMFDNVPADPRCRSTTSRRARTPAPRRACGSIMNYGYDIQAEHYRAVWKAVTGEDRRFVFIFQEKSDPYEVTLVALSGSFRTSASAAPPRRASCGPNAPPPTIGPATRSACTRSIRRPGWSSANIRRLCNGISGSFPSRRSPTR
jgi:hypothetical protein